MASIPPKTITVEGTTLTLAVERKRVKNVNARLRGSTLFISAPPELPPKRLQQLAIEMARKLVHRAHAQRTNSEEDALALAAKVAQRSDLINKYPAYSGNRSDGSSAFL